ncbi:YibE/F family protein [Vagococcus vulneris]|uniref:YibE/F family protein n=1 Tax=Vagococcus vulneris TaxID=1977869 RepID=UPI001403D3D3|nr:YibE/F family protein [Vagococcus vulneris]
MSKNKRITLFFSSVILCFLGGLVFVSLSSQLYQQDTLAQVIHVKNEPPKAVTDEKGNKESHITQQLTVKLLNGSLKNQTFDITNTFSASQIKNQQYRKGNKLFVTGTQNPLPSLTIVEAKRDTSLFVLTLLFVLLLFIVAGRQGIFTFISLCLNSVLIGTALLVYRSQNDQLLLPLFLIISPVLIFSTLFLLNGYSKKTKIAGIATLFGTYLTFCIGFIVITLLQHKGLHYEEMELITRPAHTIFLTSLFIGCLGGVMDIAVTITSSLTEIAANNSALNQQDLKQAGYSIGSEITGPMINIMIFSYLSGAIPLIIIFLKNQMSFNYTFSIVLSLELARALVGSIGIVLTVPITIFLASRILSSKVKEGKI